MRTKTNQELLTCIIAFSCALASCLLQVRIGFLGYLYLLQLARVITTFNNGIGLMTFI